MDPASIFEDALRGLATKDLDSTKEVNLKLSHSPDLGGSVVLSGAGHVDVVDDFPSLKRQKLESPVGVSNNEPDEQNDIIMSALINAGITPSSLSAGKDNRSHSVGQSVIQTIPNIKLLSTNGPTILKLLPSAASQPVHRASSPLAGARILRRVSDNRFVTRPNLPNIIRKRHSPLVGATGAPFPKNRRVVTNTSLEMQKNMNQVSGFSLKGVGPNFFNNWRNTGLNLPNTLAHDAISSFQPIKRDDDLEEEEDLAQAETYADYVPMKLNFGRKHPDPVVESSSLSSVSPPDIHYRLTLPEEVIDEGFLSALQLEAVVYACQRHECILPNGQRAGFLIGDGAGVGKGRTIAGILYENYLQHRKKAIWLSVSNDLKVDAERDLRDVGLGKIKVHSLNKFKYARISGKTNGRVKKGVIFSTYSSLIGESQGSAKAKYKTRLKQLVHWCGKKFDGLIVFDECHRAKNLTPSGSQKPTKTGLTVLELQNRLPHARIIYASATGATEPRNMAYMTRLGLWGEGTPFKTFNSFIQTLERRGVGAMELVAMDMKLRGMYIARQLSFHGVNFNIEGVDVDNVKLNGEKFVDVYNQAADLWVYAYRFFSEAAHMLTLTDRYRKTMWGQFWSAHQRFFKYLCISAKVNTCVNLAKKAIAEGKCVVIGLQSTGEAKTLEQVEEFGSDLTEFVSTSKGVFQSLVEKYFPTPANVENFSLRGDKLASAGDRSSTTTLSRAGRAVVGGQGSGLGLKDILGEKMLAKLVAGGSLSSNIDDDDINGSKLLDKNASPDSDDVDDDENSEDSGDEDSDSLLSSVTKPTHSSSSEYFDSDLELNSGSGSKVSTSYNRSKKSRSRKDGSIRRLNSRSTMDGNSSQGVSDFSDDDDWDPDAMFDSFLARNATWSVNSDSKSGSLDDLNKKANKITTDGFWGDEFSQKLTQKYLFGRNWVDRSNNSSMEVLNPEETKRQCLEMQSLLLRFIEKLGSKLPPTSLDELIDKLGGPSCVAEMTGRKGRMVMSSDGRVSYESRREIDVNLELLNLTEKQRFMDGDKLVAIISEAASSGISLQADRRAINQRRRVHITLELPWSADRAVQQFGRTHRSNQVSAPMYIFLISNLAGEQRFASTVAKRLESLGALTHGDRRATETRDLSQFNFDTKLGREALDLVLRACVNGDEGIVEPPNDYILSNSSISSVQSFFTDVKTSLQGVGMAVGRSRERDTNQMSKFLNRILGMRVHIQNSLFQYFSSTLDELTRRAKRDHRLDLGIMDLGTTGQNLEIAWTKSFDTWFLSESSKVHLHKVTAERGLSWSSAMEIYTQNDGKHDGFYYPSNTMNVKVVVPVLAICIKSRSAMKNDTKFYRLYRPNTGMQIKTIELEKLLERYKRISSPSDCQYPWHQVFKESATRCIHLVQHNFCLSVFQNKNVCAVGLRLRNYYVLSGSVLNVWARIEPLLQSKSNSCRCMQVVRLKSKDGSRIIGSLIPQECVDDVLACLSVPPDSTQTTPEEGSKLNPLSNQMDSRPSSGYSSPTQSFTSTPRFPVRSRQAYNRPLKRDSYFGAGLNRMNFDNTSSNLHVNSRLASGRSLLRSPGFYNQNMTNFHRPNNFNSSARFPNLSSHNAQYPIRHNLLTTQSFNNPNIYNNNRSFSTGVLQPRKIGSRLNAALSLPAPNIMNHSDHRPAGGYSFSRDPLNKPTLNYSHSGELTSYPGPNSALSSGSDPATRYVRPSNPPPSGSVNTNINKMKKFKIKWREG